jgi:hypothetical protein
MNAIIATMTKKARPKLIKPYKGKKVTPQKMGGGNTAKLSNLTDEEVAEGMAASEKLAKRPTKDFSRDELGALMEVAPGGAEPHQIKTQSRQFRRIIPEARTNLEPKSRFDMVEGSTASAPAPQPGERSATGNPNKKRPLSLNNYKIDEND